MEKSSRQSNFELLRIIAMVMIVMHHFSVHGGYNKESLDLFNLAVVQFYGIFGKLGVNLFVLISGYFLVSSSFKPKKVIKIALTVLFYSLLFFIIFVCIGKEELTIKTFIRHVFPLINSGYWFMTCYVLMYIFSPFINKLIRALSKGELVLLIGILIILQSIISPLFNVTIFKETAWFITLYLVGAYIRLYDLSFLKRWHTWLIFGLSLLTMAIFHIGWDISAHYMESIPCSLASISLFVAFKNMNIPNSRIINFLSGATLGVYLIHDNFFIRKVLWPSILSCPRHAIELSFPLFFIFAIASCVAVYVISTLIEVLRQLLARASIKLIHRIIKKSI